MGALGTFSFFRWVHVAWLGLAALATYVLQSPTMALAGTWLWYIYAYMALISTILLWVQMSAGPISNRKFVTRLYGSMAAKLFLSLLAVFVLIKLFPAERLSVAVAFFLYYLLFTAFEMLGLLANLRAQK